MGLKYNGDIFPFPFLPFHMQLQYDRYKGADPKPSLCLYHVQIWHIQRKQSELGSILNNFFEILNILVSRRGWTFRVWNFSRFRRKNEVPSGQRERERESVSMKLRNDAKIIIFDAQPYWNLHFHSLQLFPLKKWIQK